MDWVGRVGCVFAPRGCGPGVALRYTPGCVLAPIQGACGGDDWIVWIGLGELGVCLRPGVVAPGLRFATPRAVFWRPFRALVVVMIGSCGLGWASWGVFAPRGAEGYTREVLRALVGTALLFGNP